MSHASELAAQRRVTTAFIQSNPISVALIPVSTTRTSTGGSTQTPQPPRSVQTMRLLDLSSGALGNFPGKLRSTDGDMRKATHQLIGEWDSAMGVDDFWMDGAVRYQVMELLPYNGYERRGQVIQYAS